MNTPAGYQRVDISIERHHDLIAVVDWGFANHFREDAVASTTNAIDWSRTRGVEIVDGVDAGALAGVHGSYAYDMRVPGGGTVPTSGLTIVSVHPAHRRRGILRSMIADHFARSRARGEHVSSLIAAETAIYQRFGYALPGPSARIMLQRGMDLREVPGSADLAVRLETADFAQHAEAVRAVLARDLRPGAHATVSEPILADQFRDPESMRGKNELLRIAVVDDAEGPAAFALFQRALDWETEGPRGTGTVRSWAAATPAAARRLWSVMTSFDLLSEMQVDSVALDDHIMLLAEDARALKARLIDKVWVRILDVPGALTARTYSADLDVRIAIDDPLVSENDHTWAITVRDGVASVEEAADAADLRLDIRTLSSIYLGGVTLTKLANAGLVTGSPDVISAVSRAFRGDVMPSGTFYF